MENNKDEKAKPRVILKDEKPKPRMILRSKSVLIPLITFAVLLIIYAAYAFWYVSGQETYYNDRAFRILSVLNQRFDGSIEGIRDVLGASSANPRLEELKEVNAGSTGEADSVEGYVAEHLGQYSLTPEKVKADWKGTCEKAHRDAQLRLVEDSSGGSFSLEAEYSFGTSESDKGCSGNLTISAPLRPDGVIRPLFEDLDEGFFDDVLIADESGRVLYQQSVGGDRVADLNEFVRYKPDGTTLIPLTADSSSPKGTTPFAMVSGLSNVREVNIAGASYKLYVQPSTIKILERSSPPITATPSTMLPKTLVLSALRSTKHTNADDLSPPS